MMTDGSDLAFKVVNTFPLKASVAVFVSSAHRPSLVGPATRVVVGEDTETLGEEKVTETPDRNKLARLCHDSDKWNIYEL